MPYTYEDEDEVRNAFWQEFPQFEMVDSGHQNDQPTDTRCAFVDWIDSLARNGQISDELAQGVTL